ncbi:MAG: glycosyltransferase [Deltaproteobacteria bacterium]|nr:glycosyltransferase [Deltaproteobacteria bacterium]
MRILYVAPASPHPGNFGGGMRVAALAAALGRRADVHLLVIADEPGEEARRFLAARGAELWATPPQTTATRLWRIVSATARGHSIPAARLFSPARVEQLLAKAQALAPDVVILGETFLGEPAAALRALALRVIVDTFNVESQLWRDVAAASTTLSARWGYSLLAANTAALERRTLPVADRVWAVSEEDAAWYRRALRLQAVDVVPNVMATTAAALAAPTEPDAVVFTATYAYPPNEDAALRLISISSALAARGHTHRLYLVGRRPSARMKAAAAGLAHVVVTGEVDSVEPWLRKAAVFAAPLQLGSGTNFKLLEAMLAGRAVLTTPIGARGLDIEDGRHALIRTEEHFAGALVALLGDAALRASLAAEGRRHALEHFTEARLDAALDRALAPFGCATPGRPG